MFSKQLSQSQEHVTKFLDLAILNNRLAQGYILVGNANKDKLQSAKEIAQILNCEKHQHNNCINFENDTNQICNNCSWINDLNHPKCLTIVSLKEGEAKIKIENIRKLREDLSLTSQYYKIIYFDNAAKSVLHSPSGNALLKTLEEPLVNVLFLFSVETVDEILVTLKSRCQTLFFDNNYNRNIEPNFELIKMVNEINNNKFNINEIELIELKTTIENSLKEMNLEDLVKYIFTNQYNFHKNNLDYLEKFSIIISNFLDYDHKYVNRTSNIGNFIEAWYKLANLRL